MGLLHLLIGAIAFGGGWVENPGFSSVVRRLSGMRSRGAGREAKGLVGLPMLMIVFRCFFPDAGREGAGGWRVAGMRMGREGTGKSARSGKWSVKMQA